MLWWQAILVMCLAGFLVLAGVSLGASIADKSRMRAVLDKRAEWEPPPDGH